MPADTLYHAELHRTQTERDRAYNLARNAGADATYLRSVLSWASERLAHILDAEITDDADPVWSTSLTVIHRTIANHLTHADPPPQPPMHNGPAEAGESR